MTCACFAAAFTVASREITEEEAYKTFKSLKRVLLHTLMLYLALFATCVVKWQMNWKFHC